MSNSLDINRSILSRVRSCLIKGIEDSYLLPRAILVILDNDLLNGIPKARSYIIGAALHWLISEFNKIIDIHRDRLPERAKKADYPTFIWMGAPFHRNFKDNDEREKFNDNLREALMGHKNHIMLHPKQGWDPDDISLFKNGTFSKMGFGHYWSAVDSTFKFWCSHLAPKGESFSRKLSTDHAQDDRRQRNNDRGDDNFRRLSVPPRRPMPQEVFHRKVCNNPFKWRRPDYKLPRPSPR